MTATLEPQRLTPEELAKVIEKVKDLRITTKMTGVFTSMRIAALLNPLHTDDVCLVSKALQLKARELPRDRQVSQGVKRFNANGIAEKNYNQ